MAVTGQIHIACRGYSKYVGNVVNYSRSGKDDLFNSPAQRRSVLRANSNNVGTRLGRVMTDVATDQREFDPRPPFVDWMVYVSKAWLPTAPQIEPPGEIEHLRGGTLMVVQETPPDLENAEHQERIRRAEAALNANLQIEIDNH